MEIKVGFEIAYAAPAATPMVIMLSIHPSRFPDIVGTETIATEPNVPIKFYNDSFGNLCGRLVAPAGGITFHGSAIVRDSGRPDAIDPSAEQLPIEQLPDELLLYLMPSRYCETDRLSQIAWDTFGQLAPGWSRVQAICDFTNKHITFGYHNARNTRTAFEAYEEKVGVCRDYAHLAIAFLRCMNIPARYVNGYLGDIGVPILDPQDFSAWIEVYLGGQWMTFDPRNNVPRIGRIVVARGRDAADVPLINSFGPHELKKFRVWTYDVTGLPLPLLPVDRSL